MIWLILQYRVTAESGRIDPERRSSQIPVSEVAKLVGSPCVQKRLPKFCNQPVYIMGCGNAVPEWVPNWVRARSLELEEPHSVDTATG